MAISRVSQQGNGITVYILNNWESTSLLELASSLKRRKKTVDISVIVRLIGSDFRKKTMEWY